MKPLQTAKWRKALCQKSLLTPLLYLPTIAIAADWTELEIRAHSSDKNTISDPARISYIDNNEASNAYLFDAAVIYTPNEDNSDTVGNGPIEYSFIAEFHKNTQIKKEQDTQSVKARANYEWEHECTEFCIDLTRIDGTLEYQINNIPNNESVLSYVEMTWEQDKWHLNGLGNGTIQWYWSPTVGYEYEDVRKSDQNKTGSQFRSYANMQVAVYPFSEKFDFRLSLDANYTNWNSNSADTSLALIDDNYELKKVSLKWNLFPRESRLGIIFSIDWLNGENPRTKVADQEYVQIGFGLKYFATN